MKKKQHQDVESLFFGFDEENKIAYIQRDFEKPGDILDLNTVTKTPVMDRAFIEWLASLFDYVPRKYKLDIHVCFNDLEGFSEEALSEICRRNILLERNIQNRNANRQNTLSLILCGGGFLIILFYFSLLFIWTNGGVLKEIIMFILEIFATVPFWGAADIFFVQNSEQRKIVHGFKKRFHAISFSKKEQTCLQGENGLR